MTESTEVEPGLIFHSLPHLLPRDFTFTWRSTWLIIKYTFMVLALITTSQEHAVLFGIIDQLVPQRVHILAGG